MAPAKLTSEIPGISGTRALSDNLSDLKAQVAANNRGIDLVGDLIAEHSLPVVQAYMKFIQVCQVWSSCVSRLRLDWIQVLQRLSWRRRMQRLLLGKCCATSPSSTA